MSRWEPMLERVVAGRYPQLVAYGLLLAGSLADAEDLVQDALVSTFSGRARFKTEAEAEAYVRRAIVSRFVDTGRRRTTERRLLAREGAMAVRTTVEPPAVGIDPELAAALARLSPRERACVVLRHMEDLSTKETAYALGLSEGSVKRYLADGVAALTAALDVQIGEYAPVGEAPSDLGSGRGGRPFRRPSTRKGGA